MKKLRPPGTPRKKRFRDLSINRMIPNILTLLALAAGLTAIRFGLDGRWEHAVLAIIVAAVIAVDMSCEEVRHRMIGKEFLR